MRNWELQSYFRGGISKSAEAAAAMSERTGFRRRVAPSAHFARHLARCRRANSHSLVFWRPSPSPCSLRSPFSPSLSFYLCLSPAMSAVAEPLPPNASSLLPTLSLLRSYGTRHRFPPFTPRHLSLCLAASTAMATATGKAAAIAAGTHG